MAGMEAAYLVAATGFGSPEDKLKAEQAGFDTHLTKPVDPAVLERIIAGLRRGTWSEPPGMRSGYARAGPAAVISCAGPRTGHLEPAVTCFCMGCLACGNREAPVSELDLLPNCWTSAPPAPESRTGFQEFQTSDYVAGKLAALGAEVAPASAAPGWWAPCGAAPGRVPSVCGRTWTPWPSRNWDPPLRSRHEGRCTPAAMMATWPWSGPPSCSAGPAAGAAPSGSCSSPRRSPARGPRPCLTTVSHPFPEG